MSSLFSATAARMTPGTGRGVPASGRILCQRLCWALWLLSCWACLAQEPISTEHELKAAFVYNFPKFVQWPEMCFTNSDTPFVIGVLGEGATIKGLKTLARERKIIGRPLKVIPVQTAEEAKLTHLLFVVAGAEKEATPILSSIRESAVLTIGDTDKFAALGGMITLVRDKDKIRFRINVEAARHAGLTISAQLQQLALPSAK